ncbi:MAG: cadherin domain-containing protein [Bacteroidales bacterium]|nr:cadherin domain-containing protein [Bacteroidales bacterium]
MHLYSQTKSQTNLLLSIKFWILTLALVLIYATLIFAQNVVYIDPTNQGDPGEDGSIEHPFDQWSDVTFVDGNMYLQKRGTVSALSSNISIDSHNNITIGAYGDGIPPEITYSGSGNLISITRSSLCIVQDLKLSGELLNTTSIVAISGHYLTGNVNTNNNSVINCELSGAWNGVRSLPYSTKVDTITVLNCNIHHMRETGVFIKHADCITVEGCNIWHMGLDWHLVGHTEDDAHGNCVHIIGDCYDYLIKDNILDRRYTGNKFCFIYGNTGHTPVRGKVIGNIIYPPKDTVEANGGAGLYFSQSHYVEIAYNKFLGRGYEIGCTPVGVAHIEVDSVDFYYNLIDSVSGCNFVPRNDYANIYNNTFICNMDASWGILLSGTEGGYVRNNAVAMKSGYPILFNSTPIVNDHNITEEGNVSSWGTIFGFEDWQNGDFRIIENSPCKNTGYDYSDYFVDLDSILVPQENIRDIGSYEYYVGGQSNNNPPVINNQSFNVNENTSNGQVVGTVMATDPDAGQTLTYTIISGNTGNAFQIGSTSGVLTVANSSALDYETNPVFSLTVEVQDNGQGNLTDQATVTVNLIDVNEVPNIDDQSFAIDENSPSGQQAGTIIATDPDNGQTLTYTITAGNTSGAFQIGSTSGVITVANSSALDYETNPVFSLTVEVQDNGQGNLTDQATVTVNLTDVNEVPNIEDQSFAIDENTPNGQQAGTIIATDPDNGQTLTYTITAGNTSGAFQIGSTSGVLTVANSSVLDYETNPVFNLTVQVQDNGLGNLTDQATITVNLTDVNEIPNIEDQNFAIDENTPNGQQVGAVVATDPDNGQTLTFTITGGNTSGAFQIGSTSGVITVANSSALDYETNPVFSLTVEVQDNGQGNLTDQATVTVNLTDVNEPPVISEQSFNVDVNSELIRMELNNNKIDIGTVQASDPDIGQSVTFSIIQGNEKNIFGLNANTGELEISDPYQLNYFELNNYPLIIEVVDNSPEQLSANATINVIVNIYTEYIGEYDSGTEGGDFITSVYDMENNNFTYNIYPNPSNSYVNIGLNNLQGNKLIITIINTKGEIILEKSYKDFDTGLIDRFDVRELGKGLYLVNITNGDVSKLDKFIKL